MKSTAIHLHHGPLVPDLFLADGLAAPEACASPSEHPDARVFLTSAAGRVVAHCALWWTETPMHEGSRIGAIGGFAACDAEAARLLLGGAEAGLRTAGCRIAIGPMNGNTWRRHRFVTGDQGRGPFLLEPRNPVEHPQWWLAAGYEGISRYSSSSMPLQGGGTFPPKLRDRLGVSIRGLDPDRYDDELRIIHRISLKSFSANFLYTPLEERDFFGAYQKFRDKVDPDLVLIAGRDGVPCGFVFTLRDIEAEARREKPALIVKTLAVDPAARCAGLGSLLVDEVHRIGFAKGHIEAIHALQHESNTSLKITSRHHGTVFRRYTLFSKRL